MKGKHSGPAVCESGSVSASYKKVVHVKMYVLCL